LKFDAFTSGQSYSIASLNAAAERSVNWYAATIEGNAEKASHTLVPTPGLTLFATMPQGPIRGMFPGQNRLFVVAGSHLYEVLSNGHTNDHGSVGNDGQPVQMFANGIGTQLMVISDGHVYVDTGVAVQGPITYSILLFDLSIDAGTGGLTGATGGIFDASDVGQSITIYAGFAGFTAQTQVVTSVVDGEAFGADSWGTGGSTGGEGVEVLTTLVPASQGAYLDGYGFASFYASHLIQFSAINDFTSWNPLDFFDKATYPDNVAALQADHQELYVFGDTEASEVFQDTGASPTPFSPDPGAIMHYACIAPWTVCRLDEGLAWIGGDARRGDRLAFLAVGFRPRRISTDAVETAWDEYSTVADAIAFTYIERGHQFWCISFPSANSGAGATWVYDLKENLWHERGWFTGAFDANGFPVWGRVRQAFHCVVALGATTADQDFCGDWQNGNLYLQNASYLDDAGTAIYRLRRAPHLTESNYWRMYSRFELDCDRLADTRIYWQRLSKGRDRVWQTVSWQTASTGVSIYLAFSDTSCQTWIVLATQTLPVGVAVALANCYLLWVDCAF
jgi:hypothetical protein